MYFIFFDRDDRQVMGIFEIEGTLRQVVELHDERLKVWSDEWQKLGVAVRRHVTDEKQTLHIINEHVMTTNPDFEAALSTWAAQTQLVTLIKLDAKRWTLFRALRKFDFEPTERFALTESIFQTASDKLGDWEKLVKEELLALQRDQQLIASVAS